MNIELPSQDIDPEVKQALEKELHYRLLKTVRGKNPEYYVNVRLREEQQTVYIGTDLSLAYDLYRKIIRCHVTPCTIRDVVEDAIYEVISVDSAVEIAN